MRLLPLLALLAMCAAPAHANPPIPDGSVVLSSLPCSDNETGKRGMCHLYGAPDGTVYMVFTIRGAPQFMRRIIPGQPYTQVWTRGEVSL